MSLINILVQDNSLIKEQIISSNYEGPLFDNEELVIPEIELVYGDGEIDESLLLEIELNDELDIVARTNINNQIISIEKQNWNIDGHQVISYLIRTTTGELKLTKNDLFVKNDLQYVNNLMKLFNKRNEQIASTISYR